MNWSGIYNGVWWWDNYDTGVPCNTTALSGGPGITDNTIALSPEGGVITLMFVAFGVPDKLEIIHGNAVNGTKVATSSMNTANAGPFDDVYGTEPTNIVPTENETLSIDQFIGDYKGTIPNRGSLYTSQTGNPNPITAPYQQLVWWQYTLEDYQESSFVTVRVTGPEDTGWQFERVCYE